MTGPVRAVDFSRPSQNLRQLHCATLCNSRVGSGKSSIPAGRVLKKRQYKTIKKGSLPKTSYIWASHHNDNLSSQLASARPRSAVPALPPANFGGAGNIAEEEKGNGNAEEEDVDEELDPTEGEILEFALDRRILDLGRILRDKAAPTLRAIERLRSTGYWDDFVYRMSRPPEAFRSAEEQATFEVVRAYMELLSLSATTEEIVDATKDP
jgi:hypothetical protein